MDLPKRKRNRLKDFDYNTPGYYFITICTQGKRCILGQVVGGGALDAPKIKLSAAGKIVDQHILGGNRIPGVVVTKYVIMPNHIHILLQITEDAGTPGASSPTEERYRAQSGAVTISKDYGARCQRPLAAGTPGASSPTNAVIPRFVAALKRFCNDDSGANIFQRSYHDHVVRGEEDYLKIWNYIDGNPGKWTEDCFYVEE